MFMKKVFDYIDSHISEFVEDLRALCIQPSISAQNMGIGGCVGVLKEMMGDAGIDVKVVPVKDGNPVVFGELKSREAEQTLGFYNHYDVQPPEPLELWDFPPFEAKIKDGKIFARGVDDNKGSLAARIEAVKALKAVYGDFPVNLKFFVEGEEEIGSPHLESFVKGNMDLLKADGYVWEGDGVDEQNRPNVSLGVKGILYVEFRAKGPKRDVHSSLAPIVPNPAWRLVWLLSSLKGSDEKIKIPGCMTRLFRQLKEIFSSLNRRPSTKKRRKRSLDLRSTCVE